MGHPILRHHAITDHHQAGIGIDQDHADLHLLGADLKMDHLEVVEVHNLNVLLMVKCEQNPILSKVLTVIGNVFRIANAAIWVKLENECHQRIATNGSQAIGNARIVVITSSLEIRCVECAIAPNLQVVVIGTLHSVEDGVHQVTIGARHQGTIGRLPLEVAVVATEVEVAAVVVPEAEVAAVVTEAEGEMIPTRKMNGRLGIGNARNVEITSSPETRFVECAVALSLKEISVDHLHLFVVVVEEDLPSSPVWLQAFVTDGQSLEIVVLGIVANFHTMLMDNRKISVLSMVKCEQNPI